jgi:hypothetical protein
MDISLQVSPDLLLGVSAGYCQRALVRESGMISTQTRKHNRTEMVAVYGTPCATPPRNSNIHNDMRTTRKLYEFTDIHSFKLTLFSNATNDIL